jgi:bifunctional DNA-binding transcriptional regulator/antitoxin component of YhaV-PrlF toxin-antitoxin module
MTVHGEEHGFKVFGSMVVSPKGQVVIPAGARKEMNIASGDMLLACGSPHGGMLMLLKIDTVEKILSTMSKNVTSIEKILQDYKSGTNDKPETGD